MQILEINVGKNREVSLFVNKGGNIGENNETLLKFTVPEEFKNHYKYLDIIKNDKEKTQTVLDVGKNYEFTYTLPAFLTENRELYLQLVMKLKDEIFLSNIFVIKFDESICATQYIADNSCDTIQYLIENKADNENVNLISCELSGKLCSNVYYDELGRIYKSIDEKVDKIPGKELSENDYTDEEKEKLSVTKSNLELHIENKNNPHNVGKEQIGLGNVDNTSDINKPISIKTQNALDEKVDKIPGKDLSANDYTDEEKEKLSVTGRNLELHIENKNNPHNVGKEQIGLGNVDNTSDINKPISIKTQNALDLKGDKDYILNLENRVDTHIMDNIIHISENERASWNNKVDMEEGKQLSTEDFTTEEKTKLKNLPTNTEFEKYVEDTINEALISGDVILSEYAKKEDLQEKADSIIKNTDITTTHQVTDSADEKIVNIEFYKKNLFNKNGNINENVGYTTGSNTLLEDGTIKATANWSGGRGKGQIIDVKPNTTYTYSFDITDYVSGGSRTALEIIDVLDGTIGNTLVSQNDVWIAKKRFSFSFVTNETTTKIWISINGCKEINSGNYIIYDNIQLEESTSATDYEPHIENPTVSLYGKNLLDTRNIKRTSARVTFTSNDDGSIHITTGDTTKYGEDYIHISNPNLILKAGVTYSISLKTIGDYKNYYFLYSGNLSVFEISPNLASKSYTPKEDVLIDSIRMYCEDGKSIKSTDIYLQIEVGNFTEFEKYKDLQTAQGDEVLNLTMNYPNTTVICDCPCKVTYKADSTITYYNLKNEQEILKQAIINLGGTI